MDSLDILKKLGTKVIFSTVQKKYCSFENRWFYFLLTTQTVQNKPEKSPSVV